MYTFIVLTIFIIFYYIILLSILLFNKLKYNNKQDYINLLIKIDVLENLVNKQKKKKY